MEKLKLKKGFTLIEMLVTLSIIVIMSGVLIVYTRGSEKIGQLNRGSERLSFDVRRMASMSMQTKQVKDEDGNMRDVCGWGIHFNNDGGNKYIVFSDYCLEGQDKGDMIFEEEETQEIIKLGRNVSIIDLTMNSFIYVPPEPKLYILDTNDTQENSGVLTLSVGGNNQKIIEITNSGNFIIK